jgi:hypothetical protein
MDRYRIHKLLKLQLMQLHIGFLLFWGFLGLRCFHSVLCGRVVSASSVVERRIKYHCFDLVLIHDTLPMLLQACFTAFDMQNSVSLSSG